MQANPAGGDGFKGFEDDSLKFTGTQINYYFVCKRKLWLFSHNMELESESDLVHLGRLLHEQSYKRKFKEVQVGRIKVDFLERREARVVPAGTGGEPPPDTRVERGGNGSCPSVVIHEVKRSRSMHDAHVFQLLYYMYYLKTNYDANVGTGVLHYPLLKTNVPVELTEEKEREVKNVIDGIRGTISLANPPEAVWVKPCRSCAYMEMCWS
jgi:CRISPR-associated exonuclease Cas4